MRRCRLFAVPCRAPAQLCCFSTWPCLVCSPPTPRAGQAQSPARAHTTGPLPCRVPPCLAGLPAEAPRACGTNHGGAPRGRRSSSCGGWKRRRRGRRQQRGRRRGSGGGGIDAAAAAAAARGHSANMTDPLQPHPPPLPSAPHCFPPTRHFSCCSFPDPPILLLPLRFVLTTSNRGKGGRLEHYKCCCAWQRVSFFSVWWMSGGNQNTSVLRAAKTAARKVRGARRRPLAPARRPPGATAGSAGAHAAPHAGCPNTGVGGAKGVKRRGASCCLPRRRRATPAAATRAAGVLVQKLLLLPARQRRGALPRRGPAPGVYRGEVCSSGMSRVGACGQGQGHAWRGAARPLKCAAAAGTAPAPTNPTELEKRRRRITANKLLRYHSQ